MKYGYFQFRFVLDAVQNRDRLDFATLVAELAAEGQVEAARPTAAQAVYEALESGGIDAARERHRALHVVRPDSVLFREGDLNALGYALLEQRRIPEAVAIFGMNADAYPDGPNVYDSLGDGLSAAGRLEDARDAYARAVERAEALSDPRLPNFRANLERVIQQMDEQP